jgi:hypothetical protein
MAIGVPQGSLAGCCGGEAVLAGDCHGSVVCDLGGTGLGGGRGAQVTLGEPLWPCHNNLPLIVL